MRVERKWLVAIAASAGIGGIVGLTTSSSAAAPGERLLARGAVTAPAPAPDDADSNLCAGGEPEAVAVALVPTKIDVDDKGREAATFATTIDAGKVQGTEAAYDVVIEDVTGAQVATFQTAAPVALDNQKKLSAEKAFAALADGYYRARLMAAIAAPGGDKHFARSDLYFSVVNGTITFLDINDWLALPETQRADDGVTP